MLTVPACRSPKVFPIPAGILEDIPMKIIMDIPFPIPFSVISSPNHIRNAVPAVNVRTTVIMSSALDDNKAWLKNPTV